MKEYQISQRLMGSNFTLGVVSKTKDAAHSFLEQGIQEISRIERLLSEFISDSDTSLMNESAYPNGVQVKGETFKLIQRSLAISQLSQGDFDITVSPLKKLYNFKNDVFEFPAEALIKESLKFVGYDQIQLNDQMRSVSYTKPKSQISFAAIGKGYASDRVKKIWLEAGVTAGFINASGDLNAFGNRADGSEWRIGIANPDKQDEVLLFVPLENAAVATSGDYEQYFIHKGVRYSHNINPHTGYPLHGLKSVTVFSPSAELSDALATAAYVKGVQNGLNFINQLPQTHCIFIDENNKLFFSNDLTYEEVAL